MPFIKYTESLFLLHPISTVVASTYVHELYAVRMCLRAVPVKLPLLNKSRSNRQVS